MVATKTKNNFNGLSGSSSKCMCNINSKTNTKNFINLNSNYAKIKKHHNTHKNSNNNSSKKFNLKLIIGIWCLLHSVTVIQGAAVYTNVDFRSNPTFEPICNLQEEHFIESEGKESSLILEFNKAIAATQHKLCTRILSSPPNYGFIIRLILPKIRHSHHHSSTKVENKENDATGRQGGAQNPSKMSTFMDQLNVSTAGGLKSGRSCPLSIFSSHDPHTPQWRVDPCQLEDTAPEMEDPVRLFHGRVRIVWEHQNHTLNSKLMVTVLGKGDECRSEKKHQCLRIGDDPILCISKDLICDGIRHCPYSNEYDSDEDYTMCWKRSRLGEPMPPSMESDIFEHFALEVFRNLFAFDVPSIAKGSTSKPLLESDDDVSEKPISNKTTLHKVEGGKEFNETLTEEQDSGKSNTTLTIGKADNSSSLSGNHHRRNSTRTGVNSDLSKYGPWGYLMLGMLLCGGALLICGLWASASQHAANNERESALQSANAAAAMGQDNHSNTTAPPNYEELDPPPAYSVLFPNQKAASSNTLNSLEVASSPPSMTHLQLSPSAAPSSRSTARVVSERASGSSHLPTHSNN
ncbi:hypothetical protein FF38_01767 [Lucilia cuprina]|uniref:Uncharacterized protein n=1 Tax=Lucilia cuprina TaxID=7375 RepID=A0A0L0CQK9_LUCCU|nr:hypothetical protein CVS40_2731 [Lucilia cuprina]KNC33724.1 hypothetical protein FF38_01767 [Lucilia cuprina]